MALTKPNYTKSISEILELRQDELQKQKGISQGDIGLRIDLTQQSISKYAKYAKRLLPQKSIDMLTELFKAHDFTEEESTALVCKVFLDDKPKSELYTFLKKHESLLHEASEGFYP